MDEAAHLYDGSVGDGAALGEARVVVGDALQVLPMLPACWFQSCVTSPPYWFVRDYGVEGQLGLESDLNDYLYALVSVFRELRRVLCADGTLWLNLGDGFTSGGRASRAPDAKNRNRELGKRPPTPPQLKPKDLLGIPWQVAFALQRPWLGCPACGGIDHTLRWGAMPGQAANICPACEERVDAEVHEPGWYLRCDVIWERPNCHPESVRDRPTRSHEYVFLLSKAEQYRYDRTAVRGPNDRNLRSVWTIPTQPGKHGHIAPFPLGLADCLELTTRPTDAVIDPFAGSGTTGVAAQALGRRFLGIELNPHYATVASQRLADATNRR